METTLSTAAIVTALTSGLTEAATSMIGAVADLVPIATIVLGATLVISYGIKAFKKITGR